MKALSIRQPWAELLVSGQKTIELRSWNTKHRGPFLIHAGSQWNPEDFRLTKVDFRQCRFHCLIGRAELIGVVSYANEAECRRDIEKHLAPLPYFTEKEYVKGRAKGFVVARPYRFRVPIPYAGSLNFFEVDDEVLEKNVDKIFS